MILVRKGPGSTLVYFLLILSSTAAVIFPDSWVAQIVKTEIHVGDIFHS